tara:strand:- start:3416 stop:4708 length:1293 start_codon:yes stop_codon:yes gene_type:complete
MFNWGGPVKQGIMTGIREPYAGGGRAALVGNPVYPQTGGREHHVAPILLGIATAARAAAPWAARMGARYLPKIKRLFGTTTPGSVTKGTEYFGKGKKGLKALKAIKKGDPNVWGAHQAVAMNPSKFNPNWLGRDPTVQLIGGAGKSIFNPTVGGWAAKGARLAASPTVIIGGLYFANGRWFNKKGEELDPKSTEVVKAKAGSKDYGPHTKGAPTMTASMIDAKAKADKEKRINDLLDTMGYDKARKNAAYEALIDAGRMVSERGTLDKKNIGRELIDPIIAATSARFDKPQQIREAVGLMKVKADIAKQLEDPQVAELRKWQIENQKKALAGETLEETVTAGYGRHGGFPTGDKLAHLARNRGIEIQKVIDTSKQATGLDDIGDPVVFLQSQVDEFQEKGTPVPPGLYVVEDSILVVDEQGNVKRRPVTS